MIAKLSKLSLIGFVLYGFNGCCEKQIIYRDHNVTVKVPVKCKVPKVKCDFNRSTYTEVIGALVECVKKQRAAAEVCR